MAPVKASIDRLKEFYTYNPETGIVRRIGSYRVGALGRHGYLTLTIDGKSYLLHRLIWFYMTGLWPSEIDHIDQNKLNNRWVNLREVTRSENSLNHPLRTDNTSGVAGVTFHSETGKWRARVAGKSLGLFASKTEAATVASDFRQLIAIKP